ncbi:MAG: hypothetical protein PVF74_05050 [Anaerolineales bacterium]|jgi:hypothetical protein
MIRNILFLTIFALLAVACASAETPTPATVTEEVAGGSGAATQATAPTNTPVPPTEAAVAQTTATSTPEADPRVELGSPTWRAAFGKDTEQTWFQFDDEQAKVEMKPDELVLTAHQANSSDVWSMSYPVLTNFYLEYTVTIGEACSGKDRYGPIVRAPDNNQGYLYQISCDGMFQLRSWDGEEFSELIEWTPSEHIFQGPDPSHRLGFMAEGNLLSVYINGFLLGEIEDDAFDMGTFGISIAAADTPGFMVTMTEAVYWELP